MFALQESRLGVFTVKQAVSFRFWVGRADRPTSEKAVCFTSNRIRVWVAWQQNRVRVLGRETGWR